MITRFAPSPTGYLHVGNARTALLCFLYARKTGGKFLLRIDDTDNERSNEKYVDAIKQDLQWLEIKWDELFRQSERLKNYAKAAQKLKEQGRVYACYETEQELEIKRKMLLSRGLPPIYDREGLELTREQIAGYENQGRKPHYRFKLEEGGIEWNDKIKGLVHFEAKNLSDPIIIRENGVYTYMLPSVIDDIDYKVTNIMRGEDHVTNTAIQIQMFQALGGKIPDFAHNALIKTREGKLSKRKGDSSIRDLRESGIEPMAINSFLAKVGTSDPVEIRTELAELVREFDIHKFGKAQTIYDIDELIRLNSKLLHILPFAKVANHLRERGQDNIDEEFWLAIRPNIETLNEVKTWWNICKEKLKPVIEDGEYLKQAAEFLPEGKWDAETWNKWMENVKIKTGRKGKDLFMPIRKAITAMDHGPELKFLLPLIGREKVLARLNGHES